MRLNDIDIYSTGKTLEDTIANGDIITFFREREDVFIVARDFKKKSLQIPVDCPIKFQQVCAGLFGVHVEFERRLQCSSLI